MVGWCAMAAARSGNTFGWVMTQPDSPGIRCHHIQPLPGSVAFQSKSAKPLRSGTRSQPSSSRR